MFLSTIEFNKTFIEACYVAGTLLLEMLDAIKNKNLKVKKYIEWGTDRGSLCYNIPKIFL